MDKRLKLGILVSGRGSNMEAIIRHIEAATLDAEVAVVISDNPQSPALQTAQSHGISAKHIDPGVFKTRMDSTSEQNYVKCLQEHGVELVCLAGFMRMIKEPLLKAFPNKIVNIHPSLLPAFPGLNVQQQVLDYGAKYSGCTVHFVDAGMDSGPIIQQAVVPVEPHDTANTLAARILKEEHRIYSEALQWIVEGRIELNGRLVIQK